MKVYQSEFCYTQLINSTLKVTRHDLVMKESLETLRVSITLMCNKQLTMNGFGNKISTKSYSFPYL